MWSTPSHLFWIMCLASFWPTAYCLNFRVGGLRLLREDGFILSESETGHFFFSLLWASTLNKTLTGCFCEIYCKGEKVGWCFLCLIQTVFW